MTRYQLSVLGEIPLAVLSFLFYKKSCFLLDLLRIKYVRF